MAINWSEKNIAELELFFSTDTKKGLTREQYLQSKAQYGENIIDSEVLEQQNFYGLKKKKRNIKAMLSGSVGIIGILYFLTVIILRVMDFDVKIYVFLPFYIFLAVFALILSGNSEKKYERLYKIARPKALVIRQNKRKKVFIENIVPGDLILISAGDIIPADARIVSADYLSCIHINKNGDIIKEGKTAEILKYNPTEVPVNIVYAADVVDYGSASAIVIATGENTNISNTTNMLKDNWDNRDFNPPDINKYEPGDGYSFMQKCVSKLSRDLFLASVLLSVIIIFAGIIQNRDFIAVIMTCITASAACFPEQIAIVADFAVVYGLHRLSKFGILVKKTKIIDEINNIDTVIAKKNESFTQDKMQLKKISPNLDYEVSVENSSEIGYILSCMLMCSNVTEIGGGNKKIYSGSAIDVAVFDALKKCGLTYDAVSQVYQKIGKTVYNPKNGIKSAVVLKGGKFNLVCFGEAFNVLERCIRKKDGSFDRRSFNLYKHKIEDLYKEHDLIMAVAVKNFNYRNIDRIGDEIENNLNFLGFASFSEPKTSAVFESIDYLKKSGITPVMIADSDNIQAKSAAVKFGIVKNQASAYIIDDGKINKMGDSMFYINSDKFRLFTPVALENRIKLLKALKFRKKSPAMTVNDIEEISLLNEPCVVFTSVNTETGILKNKASVITKNLTVSTILKTVKNAVLIYRNICQIAHYWSMLFISQYLLILFAVLFNGAYILNPLQIIWSGIGLGYIFTVALCFNEENRKWHILRNKIKDYKEQKKFNGAILKYGLIYGLLIFLSVIISFFAGLTLKNSVSVVEAIKEYINYKDANTIITNIKSAQNAAFVTYIISCFSIALNYIKGPRFFDFRVFKNKVFIIASVINLLAVLSVIFIFPVREQIAFNGDNAVIIAVAVILGLCPAVIAGFFRKNMFFGRG
ncbi:MAG: cation transporting ATPase C-terminal domain-containing protein [Oscillospiraceae bacterium]|nr:cation transporting ATPase C-terminal domain-containing protein [Oscillospiraceae bacterium]